MNINFKLYNHSIINIETNGNDETEYLNLLTDGGYKFKFETESDCCSTSFISKYKEDFSVLIGKVIKGIKEIDYYEEEEQDCGNYVKVHIYEMTFKFSEDKFLFQMKNYSNGYYDGWIVSSVGF